MLAERRTAGAPAELDEHFGRVLPHWIGAVDMAFSLPRHRRHRDSGLRSHGLQHTTLGTKLDIIGDHFRVFERLLSTASALKVARFGGEGGLLERAGHVRYTGLRHMV